MKHKYVDAWYKHASGHAVAKLERVLLKPILEKLFGYYFLQCGALSQTQWLAYSPIARKILLSPLEDKTKALDVCADFSELPFKSDSIDVVLLPHLIECVSDPMRILQEVERILIPEGHVVIITFNPYSLWGIWQLLNRHKRSFPANARGLSYLRLSRYLQSLGYEITHEQGFLFRLPWNHGKASPFWEQLGRRCWPALGGLTLLVAKKKVLRLTPIEPLWRMPLIKIGKKVIETGMRTLYGKR